MVTIDLIMLMMAHPLLCIEKRYQENSRTIQSVFTNLMFYSVQLFLHSNCIRYNNMPRLTTHPTFNHKG